MGEGARRGMTTGGSCSPSSLRGLSAGEGRDHTVSGPGSRASQRGWYRRVTAAAFAVACVAHHGVAAHIRRRCLMRRYGPSRVVVDAIVVDVSTVPDGLERDPVSAAPIVVVVEVESAAVHGLPAPHAGGRRAALRAERTPIHLRTRPQTVGEDALPRVHSGARPHEQAYLRMGASYRVAARPGHACPSGPEFRGGSGPRPAFGAHLGWGRRRRR